MTARQPAQGAAPELDARRSFGGSDGNSEWQRMTPEQKRREVAAYGPRNAKLFKDNPRGAQGARSFQS